MDFLTTEGGAKKRKTVHKKKAAPSAAWKRTGRKATIKGAQRSLYRNGTSGKIAYRKRVAGTNGKPGTFKYCAVPSAGMRGGDTEGPPSLGTNVGLSNEVVARKLAAQGRRANGKPSLGTNAGLSNEELAIRLAAQGK